MKYLSFLPSKIPLAVKYVGAAVVALAASTTRTPPKSSPGTLYDLNNVAPSTLLVLSRSTATTNLRYKPQIS